MSHYFVASKHSATEIILLVTNGDQIMHVDDDVHDQNMLKQSTLVHKTFAFTITTVRANTDCVNV